MLDFGEDLYDFGLRYSGLLQNVGMLTVELLYHFISVWVKNQLLQVYMVNLLLFILGSVLVKDTD